MAAALPVAGRIRPAGGASSTAAMVDHQMPTLLTHVEISDAPGDSTSSREVALQPLASQIRLTPTAELTVAPLRNSGMNEVCRCEAGPGPSRRIEGGQGLEQLSFGPALPPCADHDAQPLTCRLVAEQVELLQALVKAPDASADRLRLVAYATG